MSYNNEKEVTVTGQAGIGREDAYFWVPYTTWDSTRGTGKGGMEPGTYAVGRCEAVG